MNINKNIPKTATFSFDETETDSIKKIIDNLDSRKSGIFGGIPANCLKGVSDISAKFLHIVWNDEVLKDLKFPSELKLADVVLALKKEDSTLVENYITIRYKIKTNLKMCIMMYLKIQSENSIFLCPEDDLVNKSKI